MSMSTVNHSNTTFDNQIKTSFFDRYCKSYDPNETGKASEAIRHVESLLFGEKVALWCRVSDYPQNHKGNLDDSEKCLRAIAKERGLKVIAVFRYVGTGKELSQCFFDAIVFCLENNCSLLAESTDRYIRHPRYHSSECPLAQARQVDIDNLKSFARGVILCTAIDPDAMPGEVRSFQTMRGQQQKNRKGGQSMQRNAGYKKRIREEKMPVAIEMRKQGMSIGGIALSLSIHKATVQYWLK